MKLKNLKLVFCAILAGFAITNTPNIETKEPKNLATIVETAKTKEDLMNDLKQHYPDIHTHFKDVKNEQEATSAYRRLSTWMKAVVLKNLREKHKQKLYELNK